MPRPNLGDVQFVCYVTPAAEIEAAAREAGWTPSEHGSPSDYVSIENYEERHCFPSFDKAVAFGQKFVADLKDYWGEVRVYLDVFEEDEFEPSWRHWHNKQIWAVTDDDVTEMDHGQ